MSDEKPPQAESSDQAEGGTQQEQQEQLDAGSQSGDEVPDITKEEEWRDLPKSGEAGSSW
jgi:hypothetical protein